MNGMMMVVVVMIMVIMKMLMIMVIMKIMVIMVMTTIVIMVTFKLSNRYSHNMNEDTNGPHIRGLRAVFIHKSFRS